MANGVDRGANSADTMPVMVGVAPESRPTRGAVEPTARIRAICNALPFVTERLSHGESSWFVDNQKNFVAMSDHHHGDRVFVTFAAAAGVQESLLARDPVRYLRPPYVGARGWVGAYLDSDGASTQPEWDLLEELIADAWHLVAPPKLRQRLE